MLYVFAGIVFGLCIAALIDELKPGGSLFPAFDGYYDDPVEYDLPMPEPGSCECAIAGDFECPYERCLEHGWDEDSVALTLAEIQAL